MSWDLQQGGDIQRIIWRIKYHSQPYEHKEGTRHGYYHGGGALDEVCAFVSLFTRQYVAAGGQVRQDDQPIRLPPRNGQGPIRCRSIAEGVVNLSDALQPFALLDRIPEKNDQRLISAARNYQRALRNMDLDGEMAYLNFITAIELFSQEHKIKVAYEELENPYKKIFSYIEDESIRDKLVQKLSHLSKKFVSYMLHMLDEPFWSQSTSVSWNKLPQEEASQYFKNLYDARSELLHSGTPLPPGTVELTAQPTDFANRLGIQAGDRRWQAKHMVPHISFLERATHYILMRQIGMLAESKVPGQ
ncbi:MAG: hypothetical protein K1X53_16535 [Candidatus Sumerlaeaceae bacterium]|nr:hypothetical protein [Candidatus Sumerlaeaceae bacterium]